MSGTFAHKILTILIVVSVARVPLPWAHRHADMDTIELPPHLVAMHSEQVESALPAGWHLHFIVLGAGNSCDQEEGCPDNSRHRPHAPDNYTFDEVEIDCETEIKAAVRACASSEALTQNAFDIQAAVSLCLQNSAQDESRRFAEPGQWGYAPSVLLI